jgi:hypothetical protein
MDGVSDVSSTVFEGFFMIFEGSIVMVSQGSMVAVYPIVGVETLPLAPTFNLSNSSSQQNSLKRSSKLGGAPNVSSNPIQ